MSPLVSVIIPYYNRPVKIVRCINSVLAQVYSNYEIIVVDDCSEIPYESHNERVQIVRNESNLGPGLSRNRGKELAKGDYIAFLDSDDYWHPDFLYECARQLDLNASLAMVYTDGINVDEFEKLLKKRRTKSKPPNTILPQILYSGRYWGTGGCLWRTTAIKNITFINARAWEDYAFDIAVAIFNNEVQHINKILVYYDVTGEQKLSKQSEISFIKEKHKSINFISNILTESGFKNDRLIQKSITILIILNLVKLLRINHKRGKYYKEHIKSLRVWQNKRFSVVVFLVCSLPNRFAIKYLKKLKRDINQDKLNIFIR